MYLRTATRKNKDGSVVTYYQLAHNVRNPESKVSEVNVIYNLGRADTVKRDDLVRLCKSISRVCGLTIQDNFDSEQSDDIRSTIRQRVKAIGSHTCTPAEKAVKNFCQCHQPV